MARSSPYSCGNDIEIMIRTGVWDWRHRTSKRYRWPRKAILLVQSNRLNMIYHSTPKSMPIGGAKHAECAFLEDLESADQSLSFDDLISQILSLSQQMTEYELYINYSPCVDCADRIIQFINNHPSVEFHIHYAMTYQDGGGLRKLKNQDRITLATMNDNNWHAVALSFLDIHIHKLLKLKQKFQDNSGYKSLQITVEDLGIESCPGWIQWREKSDKNETKKLQTINEEVCDLKEGCNDEKKYKECYDDWEGYDEEGCDGEDNCDNEENCDDEESCDDEEGYYDDEEGYDDWDHYNYWEDSDEEGCDGEDSCDKEENCDGEESCDDEEGYYDDEGGYDDWESDVRFRRGHRPYGVAVGQYGRPYRPYKVGYRHYGRGYRQYGSGYGYCEGGYDYLEKGYGAQEGYDDVGFDD
ncbi:uncharacterized protein [Asterias amurensis]